MTQTEIRKRLALLRRECVRLGARKATVERCEDIAELEDLRRRHLIHLICTPPQRRRA